MSVVNLQFSVFSKPITTDCLLKTLTLLAGAAAFAVACGSGESTPTPTPEPEAVIEPTPLGPSPSQMEMAVETIGTDPGLLQHVVVLKAKDSDRYLLIWIGPFEANAIAAEFYSVAVTRPQTHDLRGTVIDTLGATIDHVVVSDLRDGTFYARVVLRTNGTRLEVDSRPSDAIALAVRTEAPIYARAGSSRSPESIETPPRAGLRCPASRPPRPKAPSIKKSSVISFQSG